MWRHSKAQRKGAVDISRNATCLNYDCCYGDEKKNIMMWLRCLIGLITARSTERLQTYDSQVTISIAFDMFKYWQYKVC